MPKSLRKIGLVSVAALAIGGFAFWLLSDRFLRPPRMSATVYNALQRGEQFELLSLDPSHDPAINPSAYEGKERFHDYLVLGKTSISDVTTRKKLLAALFQGIMENEGPAAGCFNPRHGIRVADGETNVDLVICFECYQIEVYAQNLEERGLLVSRSPQPLFDQILREAGVPLPPPAKK